MAATAVESDEWSADSSAEDPKHRPQCGPSDNRGSSMEEVLKRLGAVEVSVSDIKSQVTASLPHLATKAEMNAGFGALNTQLSAIAAVVPHLATKSELEATKSSVEKLRAEMHDGFGALKAEVTAIAAVLPNLATKSNLGEIAAAIPNLATKSSLSEIAAAIPNLATKSSVSEIAAAIPNLATKSSVSEIAAVIPHLATKADINARETKLIQWTIATVIATAGLVFSIVKLVH